MVNEPLSPGSKTRVLSIADAGGQPIWTMQTQGFAMYAKWRPDGRMVAVNNTGPTDAKRPLVLRVSNSVVPLSLPAQLDPLECLEEADRKPPLRWSANDVRAEKWLENSDLEMETFGSVAHLDENKQPTGYVMVRVRWVLHFTDDGRVEVVSRQREAYQKTKPKR